MSQSKLNFSGSGQLELSFATSFSSKLSRGLLLGRLFISCLEVVLNYFLTSLNVVVNQSQSELEVVLDHPRCTQQKVFEEFFKVLFIGLDFVFKK